ncbi:MAG: response regulator transcription factor [Dehalococcoidales bacterium]|nr:response regulator transcription factor [Dehalococcoidales bacterium]
MAKILVVDDENRIVDIVKAYLEREGYEVSVAYDGKAALEAVKRQSPDLVILDLMLPQVSGWDVCRALRADTSIPIIMLTARDDVTDKIVGLELGADDYVTKPFDPKELVSRVKAVLRRTSARPMTQPVLKVADLTIDLEKRAVRRGNESVELTPMEFDLLVVLAQNPGRVFSRMQLLDKVQGVAYEGYERTIDSHIKNLRKKIEPDANQPRYVLTVHGVGYKVPEEVAHA